MKSFKEYIALDEVSPEKLKAYLKATDPAVGSGKDKRRNPTAKRTRGRMLAKARLAPGDVGVKGMPLGILTQIARAKAKGRKRHPLDPSDLEQRERAKRKKKWSGKTMPKPKNVALNDPKPRGKIFVHPDYTHGHLGKNKK